MMVVEKTYAVTPTGVGRVDYSVSVESAVESEIKSYQSEYNYPSTMIPVAAGGNVVTEIEITTKTVVLLYDVFLSTPNNKLLGITIEAWISSVWVAIGSKNGYCSVEVCYSRGFPIFDKYRITIYNYGDIDVDTTLSTHGIYTSEDEYYGTYTP